MLFRARSSTLKPVPQEEDLVPLLLPGSSVLLRLGKTLEPNEHGDDRETRHDERRHDSDGQWCGFVEEGLGQKVAQRQHERPQGDVIQRSILDIKSAGTANDGRQQGPDPKRSSLETIHELRGAGVELLGEEAVVPEALHRVSHRDDGHHHQPAPQHVQEAAHLLLGGSHAHLASSIKLQESPFYPLEERNTRY